jgi:hypothetical protein
VLAGLLDKLKNILRGAAPCVSSCGAMRFGIPSVCMLRSRSLVSNQPGARSGRSCTPVGVIVDALQSNFISIYITP